jgi:tripeptide aminopeptidase
VIDQKLADIFLNLIRIEGLSGSEKEVAEHIRTFLSQYQIEVQEDNSHLKSKSNTGNLIATINGGGSIVLLSHMDTARSTSGVKPICGDDRISSDGTTVLGVDNRAGISILLYLIKYINDNNIKTKGFTLAFTTCEETTLEGSKNLKLSSEIKNGFVFDSYLPSGSIVNTSYGAASFEVEIIGKAAHSGIEPEKGINSILIAAESISKIKLGRINSEVTINIGKISGGTAVNVVPERTILKGEVRSKTKKLGNEYLAEIENEFINKSKIYKADINFNHIWEFEPYTVGESNRTFSTIAAAIEKAGLKPEAKISWGGSDANSLNSLGIETVNLGIGAQNPHSNEEFILYKDFQNSFNIALELVKL